MTSTTVERIVTLRVPTPSTRYLDELCRLRCAPQLIGLFPNAKEVTETFGVWRAACDWLGYELLTDSSVLAVVPGDGTRPRTGACVVLRSAWRAISVDPSMRPEAFERHQRELGVHAIKRLEVVRGKAEDRDYRAGRIVVLAVHSHAPLLAVVARCHADRVDVISMSCCKQDDLGQPVKVRRDKGVWSPQNVIRWYRCYG